MSARRFAFVVPRYASERRGAAPIVGGAEVHCRAVVERLAAHGHDVRVLTTTAASYQTWRNEYPAGEETVSGVRVTRFATRAPRLFPFDEILKAFCTRRRKGDRGLARLRAYDNSPAIARKTSDMLQRAWIQAQGPIVPGLVDAIGAVTADVVVFFGYLYYPTIFGLPRARGRSMLVPLADEEAMLYAPIVRRTLRSPRAIFANVDEEAERICAIAGDETPPIAAVALGLDDPPPNAPTVPVSQPYILVLGRAGKAGPIVPLFRALAGQNGLGSIELDDGRQVDASNLHLVVAGEDIPQLRGVPRVIQLGRVEDDVRWALVCGALAMVSPSTSESLSLVVLEAWLAGRSVIVNEACDVTAGHVRRSGGGVAINFTEASAGAGALVAAITDRSTRFDRARRGREYVRARYSWGPVVDAYETVADAIVAGGDVGAALRSWAGRHRSWVR